MSKTPKGGDFLKQNVSSGYHNRIDAITEYAEKSTKGRSLMRKLQRGSVGYTTCSRCNKQHLSKYFKSKSAICRDCTTPEDILRFAELKRKKQELINKPLSLDDFTV